MSQLYRVFHKGLSGSRKNSMFPADDTYLDKVMEIIEKAPNADYYESIYLYEKEHVDQVKATGSLAGIRNVKTNRIVLDFDHEDLSVALDDAREALKRLIEITPNPEKTIRIFFSGNKGFHLEVHLNSYIERNQFEDIIDGLAGDLQTFDTKVKDQQRLFRFPLTRNQETMQYKIPLTIDDLNALFPAVIKHVSRKPDHTQFYELLNSYETIDLPEEYKTLKKRTKTVERVVSEVQGDKPDLSRKPKHLTPAKFVLQEGYFQEGERNEACMILAATYKYLGYNKEHTYNIIKATLRMRTERLGLEDYDKSELWRTIIEPVYSPTWKGATYSEEDGLLKLTIERYELDKYKDGVDVNLVDLTSLSAHFMDFATNIDANTIKLGIDEIDSKLRITTSSLVAFLAAPSAGKSSVSFGILNTVSKTNEKAIFFSMDMSIPQVYQRLIQRHTGHNEDIIMNNYKNNRHEIERYQEILATEYSNVKFCFRAGMTPGEVRSTILQHQQTSGIMPRLVILDYLECMKAEGISDSAQSKAQISTELKGIANELGVCIILLVQPRMMAGGPAGELNSYTDIKGSSVISEAAAQVITMSRPGFSPKNPEDDNYVTINVVKNRMGKLSSTDLYWDGLTGHIRSLSGEEENDLKALRSAIAAEKEESSGDLY